MPPIRRRLGYSHPEHIPTSYPGQFATLYLIYAQPLSVPNRERVAVSSEFDDPPRQKSQEELEIEKRAQIPEFKIR